MQKVIFKYNIEKDIENCLYQLLNIPHGCPINIKDEFYNKYKELNKKNLSFL